MIKTHQSTIKTNFDSMYNEFAKKGILDNQFQQNISISADTN